MALVLLAGTLTLSSCAQVHLAERPTAPDPELSSCDGALVVVDGRQLGGTGHGGYADPTVTCVPLSETASAQQVLADAAVTPTRSDAGSVCRVDGVPEEFEGIARPGGGLFFEDCTADAPDFARWVLWHQDTTEAWSDSEQDVRTLTVRPGDRVALVYSYDSVPTPPGA